MRGSTRLIAALKVDVEFMENYAERLFALVPHITDKMAKEDCLGLAREIETRAAQIRERIEQLEEDAGRSDSPSPEE